MQKIESTIQLDALRVEQRAVLFLWVDWAIHARNSATTVEHMIARWNREHPESTIVLSQIDLSEQAGGLWDAVAELLAAQGIPDAGLLMYGGNGAITWLRSGNIVRYLVKPNSESLDELIELTRRAFGASDSNGAT